MPDNIHKQDKAYTMDLTQVSVVHTPQKSYPIQSPFHPDMVFPEYTFDIIGTEPNPIYQGIREAFNLAGLDVANYGTADWNPLKELIKPGETVLLKPNLVKETHPRDPVGWTYVLTHGSIIRAVADYVWKALQGEGKVILGDAPQTDSSFSTIAKLLGLNELSEFYASLGLDFEIVDLRKEEWVNQGDVIVARNKLSGDPHGYISFDLGSKSEFAEHSGEGHYYGADYDAGEVNYHHSGGRHEYLIAGTAVHADVIFSLPKLKTHKKAGITVSLKNLVGINGDKNWLPHHTEGDPSTGGDERPFLDMKDRSERSIVPVFRWFSLNIPGLGPQIHRFARRLGSHLYGDTEDIVRSGNWWGNDTVWRMCLDLNKIVLYGNPDGTFRSEEPLSQKRHYVLVDGILAGEGRGPMNPDPVPAGIIVFGIHPASVDAACAYLMGFDPENIPIVRQAFLCDHFPLAQWNWRDVTLLSNKPAWNGILPDIPDDSTLKFKPHFGWIGHIERSSIREESYDIP